MDFSSSQIDERNIPEEMKHNDLTAYARKNL